MAADPDPEDGPAAGRDLERPDRPGEDGRMTVHHVRHEAADRDPIRPAGGEGEHRPALEDRRPPIAPADEVVPRPDAGVPGGFEPGRAREPPTGLGPDDAEGDADRPAAAAEEAARVRVGRRIGDGSRVGPAASRHA
jgi:hypothetical protein